MDLNDTFEEFLLPEDFDDENDVDYKANPSFDDEHSDIADKFDIFPSLLASESKFYPKSWRY